MGKFELDSEFTPAELETLLNAMDDWENAEAQTLDLIDSLKKFPESFLKEREEDGEEEEVKQFRSFKDHMLGQEKELRNKRKLKRERAILLKAKILLINEHKAIDKLGEEASKTFEEK